MSSDQQSSDGLSLDAILSLAAYSGWKLDHMQSMSAWLLQRSIPGSATEMRLADTLDDVVKILVEKK